ncbi:MAG: RpoL/Rpb11 RNA polymerase subunit family protein [Candidatus Geothermarchaeota archaeon]
MKVEIQSFDNKMLRFVIKGCDYTLSNLLQFILLKDKNIQGAGFYVPHPLQREVVFTVFFKKATKWDEAKTIIMDDIRKLKEYILGIKNIVCEATKSRTPKK